MLFFKGKLIDLNLISDLIDLIFFRTIFMFIKAWDSSDDLYQEI